MLLFAILVGGAIFALTVKDGVILNYINRASVYELLLLLALVIATLCRYLDRKLELSKYEKSGVIPSWERQFRAMQCYQHERGKHKIRTWCRKELCRFLDYFNILRAIHERKRDKLAASILSQMDPKSFQSIPWEEDPRKRMAISAYEAAELALQAAKELRTLEQVEKIVKKSSLKGEATPEAQNQ